MSFIKTSFWGALIIISNLTAGFISQKLYAIYTGNAGIVSIGNFNNFSSIFQLMATGGIMSGIVSLVSKNNYDKNNVLQTIINFLTISSLLSLITGIIFFTPLFNIITNGNHINKNIIKLYFLTLPFQVYYLAALQILTATSKIKQYSLTLIISQIINILTTYFLVVYYKINGAILSLYLPTIIMFFITITSQKEGFIYPNFKKKFIDLRLYKTLLKFSVVTIVSVGCLYLYQFLLRNYLIVKLNMIETSYWQVVITLSKIWMSFIIYIISVYYFPRLAKITTNIRTEFIHFFKIFTPMVFIVFLIIYFLREYILLIIYNQHFTDASNYFSYQLLSDFIKIGGIFLGYYSLAKSLLKKYIAIELIYYTALSILSFWFLEYWELKGIFIAQILSSTLYLIFHLVNYSNHQKNENFINRRF